MQVYYAAPYDVKSAYSGDAAYDLRATEEVTLHKGEVKAVHTGFRIAIPAGYVGIVSSRSGHGFKQGITLANSIGVIDSGYRGECMVALRFDGVKPDNYQEEPVTITVGSRIAQLMLVPILNPDMVKVPTLPESERGENGFGSSGVK